MSTQPVEQTLLAVISVVFSGPCNIELRRVIVLRKSKNRGENDGIFGWGFLIWMPVGTKQVLSADHLFFYERASRSWCFYTVSKSTLTFPRVLG
jgi:hypothetical protein